MWREWARCRSMELRADGGASLMKVTAGGAAVLKGVRAGCK